MQTFRFTSGDGEIRTLDPLLARQVLSQLSYAPIVIWQPPAFPYRFQYSIIGRPSLKFGMGTGVTPGRIATRYTRC